MPLDFPFCKAARRKLFKLFLSRTPSCPDLIIQRPPLCPNPEPYERLPAGKDNATLKNEPSCESCYIITCFQSRYLRVRRDPTPEPGACLWVVFLGRQCRGIAIWYQDLQGDRFKRRLKRSWHSRFTHKRGSLTGRVITRYGGVSRPPKLWRC